VLKSYVRKELIKVFYRTQRKYPDWYFHQINTADDHAHVLMEIPPKYSVAAVVQKLKSHSSAHLKQKFKFLGEIYDQGPLWSTGYFVSIVGLNEEQISRYISIQNKDDVGHDIQNEFS
jgi:putative transposase